MKKLIMIPLLFCFLLSPSFALADIDRCHASVQQERVIEQGVLSKIGSFFKNMISELGDLFDFDKEKMKEDSEVTYDSGTVESSQLEEEKVYPDVELAHMLNDCLVMTTLEEFEECMKKAKSYEQEYNIEMNSLYLDRVNEHRVYLKKDYLTKETQQCILIKEFSEFKDCVQKIYDFAKTNSLQLTGYERGLVNSTYSEFQKIEDRKEFALKLKKEQEDLWESVALVKSPEKEETSHNYSGSIIESLHEKVQTEVYNDEVISLTFYNNGSPSINPDGISATGDLRPNRKFSINMSGNARNELSIDVVDDVAVQGTLSGDLMNTEIHILPRKFTPAFVKKGNEFELTLFNGEKITFDEDNFEITSGVLKERAMDRNRSRHARLNPIFDYDGQGIAMFTDQRGNDPRDVVGWGKNHTLLKEPAGVKLVYPAKYSKACYIDQRKLWKASEKYDHLPHEERSLYHSEEELYQIIEKNCKWDLAEIREWFNS